MNKMKSSYRLHRVSRFLKHTTPKRLANLALSQVEYRLGVSRPRAISPLVYIDPVNYCNLRCPLCPTGQHALGRDWGKMPFQLFQDLVDEIADRIYFLNLYNWGEPLLHPQIFDMVEYATRKGLSVRISSNLNKMTSEHARRMVESGLEDLLIDVDGATQETYATYRVGGQLTRVLESIREIVEVKDRLKSPYPLITARTLVNRFNQAELHKIQAVVWSLGVDRFQAVPIYVNRENPKDVQKWVPVPEQQLSVNHPDRPRKCEYLWHNLTVSWDGGVFPCCWFHQKEYDFGNVREAGGVMAVLSNEQFVQSRRFVAGKTAAPPDTICAQCKGYPEYYYSYSDGE